MNQDTTPKNESNINNNGSFNSDNNNNIMNEINILKSDVGFLTKILMGHMSEEVSFSKKKIQMEKDINYLRKEVSFLKKKIRNTQRNKKQYRNINENDKNNSEIIFQIEPADIILDEKNNPKNKSSNSQIMLNNPLDKIFDMIIKSIKDKESKMNIVEEESEEENEITEDIKVEELSIEIKSIEDLISLSDYYLKILSEGTKKKNKNKEILVKLENKEEKYPVKTDLYELNGKLYSVNLETVHKLSIPLKKLKLMIGLHKVKDSILDMILYYIQNFEKSNKNMLHTVIEGPPGVGKTELGRIIGEVYASMGVIKSNKFKIVRRTDLIGEYVGHTAHKTQRAIDEANGGVLFIDEAYSLGSREGKDSFSKECIDTINQNLSEQKKNLIVIIAGYPNELEKCFFAHNPGLHRRFPFRYSIEGYNEKEMKDIFMKKINDIKWKLNENIKEDFISNFFKDNMSKFVNYGGDIDNLITMCKFSHSRRIVGKHPCNKKKLNKDDILNGMKRFMDMNKSKEQDKSFVNNMYL